MSFSDKIAKAKKDFAGLDQANIDSALTKYTDDILKLQTNANEVEHTLNTGYGKELVPVDELSNMVYNQIPKHTTFLTSLPGFHGNNMGVSERVSVVGDLGFAVGNAEWTTGAGVIEQGNNRVPTANVIITQAPMIFSIDIAKRLKNHSIMDLENYVAGKISEVAGKTVESMILNCDTETAATGNINSVDGAPASNLSNWLENHTLQLDNGMRKIFLNGVANVDYVDIGVLDFDKYISTRALLGDNSADLDNLLLISNASTYNKTLVLDEFKNQNNNGAASTIVDGKLVNKLAGVEYVIHRSYPMTDATGNVSITPANNTKGGFSYLYKPAVQWGYGQSIETDTVKIPGKWVSVIATFEAWFTIVNKQAGEVSPSVVWGINVTV